MTDLIGCARTNARTAPHTHTNTNSHTHTRLYTLASGERADIGQTAGPGRTICSAGGLATCASRCAIVVCVCVCMIDEIVIVLRGIFSALGCALLIHA